MLIEFAIYPEQASKVAIWAWVASDNQYSVVLDLGGLPPEQQPAVRAVLVTSAFSVVPFTVLLGAMFWAHYMPQFFATLAIIAGAVLLPTCADMRLDLRRAAGRSKAALGVRLGRCRWLRRPSSTSITIGVPASTGLEVKPCDGVNST